MIDLESDAGRCYYSAYKIDYAKAAKGANLIRSFAESILSRKPGDYFANLEIDEQDKIYHTLEGNKKCLLEVTEFLDAVLKVLQPERVFKEKFSVSYLETPKVELNKFKLEVINDEQRFSVRHQQ